MPVRSVAAAIAVAVLLYTSACSKAPAPAPAAKTQVAPANTGKTADEIYKQITENQQLIADVKSDLLAYAAAEQNFFRANSRFGSAGEIGGDLPTSRGPYAYSVELTQDDFYAVAKLAQPKELLADSILISKSGKFENGPKLVLDISTGSAPPAPAAAH